MKSGGSFSLLSFDDASECPSYMCTFTPLFPTLVSRSPRRRRSAPSWVQVGTAGQTLRNERHPLPARPCRGPVAAPPGLAVSSITLIIEENSLPSPRIADQSPAPARESPSGGVGVSFRDPVSGTQARGRVHPHASPVSRLPLWRVRPAALSVGAARPAGPGSFGGALGATSHGHGPPWGRDSAPTSLWCSAKP